MLIRRFLPKPVHYRIAEAYRTLRRGLFPSRVIEREFRGHHLKILIADSIAAAWYERSWIGELAEFAQLEQHGLRAGARVLDIGAHQAVVALMLSRIVGPSGQVVAVEADPWNAKVAVKNQQLNDASNLIVLRAAIGDCDGAAFPHQPQTLGDRVYDWSLKKVAFRSVDSLSRQFGLPDVVYCDVDGFEASVLRGASATLDSPADWFVEVHVGCGLENEGSSWQEVVDFFPPERFDRYIAAEGMRALSPFNSRSKILTDRFFLLAIHRMPINSLRNSNKTSIGGNERFG